MEKQKITKATKGITNRFVNYASIDRGRLRGGMGSNFNHEHLTELGVELFSLAKTFVGKPPKYRGTSKVGVYLKWVVENIEEKTSILVLRDYLIEEKDYEVKLDEMEGKIARPCLFSQSRRRSYYKIDGIKVWHEWSRELGRRYYTLDKKGTITYLPENPSSSIPVSYIKLTIR